MKCCLALLAALALVAVQVESKRLVCYYGSWAVYRPGDGKFDVDNIDPTLCTHYVYTFVGVGSEGQVTILDSWNEVDKGALTRFAGMKQRSPGMKVLVAAGGWNAGSYTFSQVVGNDGLRAKYADSIVAFLDKWGFDGFDLDWEYPTQRGGAAADRENFIKLLQDIRTRFDQKGYILSAAVSAGIATIDPAYDIPAMNQYLDFINVMAYDLHGSWEPVTGENAPLYAGPSDTTDSAKTLNVDSAVRYWISKGADKQKINMGMGTYGRTFSLQDPNNNGVGAPTTGPGEAGPYTREGGNLGFNELCEQKGQWTEHWNDAQQVPYAVKGNQWVGYDNQKSIGIKCQYILDNDLGGGMVWSVETDDFLGKCGLGNNPLLNTMKSALGNGGVTEPTNPTDPPTNPTDPPTNPTDPPTDPPTQPPTDPPTNPPVPGGICQHEGFVRDPNDCSVYYECVVEDGQLVPYREVCGAGTVFDTVNNICNWPANVQC